MRTVLPSSFRLSGEEYHLIWSRAAPSGSIQYTDQCSYNFLTVALLESWSNGVECLQVLVEYDDMEWHRREWISIYKDNIFQVFMVENSLVWCDRKDPLANHKSTVLWPALVSDLFNLCNSPLFFTGISPRKTF